MARLPLWMSISRRSQFDFEYQLIQAVQRHLHHDS